MTEIKIEENASGASDQDRTDGAPLSNLISFRVFLLLASARFIRAIE